MPHHSDDRPRKSEDEFFTRQDAELLKSMREELDKERELAERMRHHMRCPKCGGNLAEIKQGDVKVDRCEDCHGVWLDAGELDLIAHAVRSANAGTQFMDGLFGFFQRRGK